MADGMREKTTNVGGVIKRIWYAMTGATQGSQLLSLDDAGNLEAKLLNPVINGTATGTGITTTGEANKLLKTDASGNVLLNTGGTTIIKLNPSEKSIEANGIVSTAGTDFFGIKFKNFYSSGVINKAGIYAVTDTTTHTGRIEFRTSADSNEATTKFTLFGNGSATLAGPLTVTQFKLSALNTAPASATATGTTGEIRIDANYIYVCTATNTWKRIALTTW